MGTQEQRRTTRQTDPGREMIARAIYYAEKAAAGRKPGDQAWEYCPDEVRERYYAMADAATHYDSRVDTLTHIARVRDLLDQVAHELTCRGQRHDQSKLASPEREAFDEHTPKLKETTYGSGEYKAALDGMSGALDHHYAENSHHPEHYSDGIAGMNLLDLVEMLCDWKAATERHNDGNIVTSLVINAERFGIDAQLALVLANTVHELGWAPHPADELLARKEEAGGERGD